MSIKTNKKPCSQRRLFLESWHVCLREWQGLWQRIPKKLYLHKNSCCDEIENTPETASIISNDKTNYWLIAVALLAIAYLLLLAVVIVKYYMKRGWPAPWLLWY